MSAELSRNKIRAFTLCLAAGLGSVAACSSDDRAPRDTAPSSTLSTAEQAAEPSSMEITASCAEGEVVGIWLHAGDVSDFVPFERSRELSGVAVGNVALNNGEIIGDQIITGFDYGCGGTPERWAVNCQVDLSAQDFNTHLEAETYTFMAECENQGLGNLTETVIQQAHLIP